MKKILLIANSFLILFTSCSSNNDDPISNVPEVKSKRLSIVKKNGSVYLKFNYLPDGKLSGYDQYLLIGSTTALQQILKIEYSGDYAIKYNSFDANNVLKGYQSFFYTGKYITKREIYNVNSSGQNTLTTSSTYVNDSNKTSNNISEIKYYDANNSLTKKWSITYTNNLGSSISDIYDSSGTKVAISTWTKDDKISWEQYLDPFTYQNEHNLTSKIEKNTSTGVETGYNAQYTYDEFGYPITSKYTYTNGNIENYTFVWE
ncbi:hypothetical protein PFY12_14495 [Chryseobacterium camelliae]|uniref:YD repeat-containing protein n=1 Tax=Chryseobacterium camelliae TaxID=1265445 RepID=A0ABY7QLL1_9FLAO|nr:hypothetical protein [Chryseobacterium camelliae]WBV60234.1 hypothetical protein PFY12_14495 [Chryseobacterium camelliae]